MKHSKKFIFLLFVIITACKGEYVATQKPHADLVSNVDDYFSQLTKIHKFNGSVLLQKDGQVILSKTYNMKGNVPRSLKVSEHSQFDIHSISKLMAQACVVKLEQDKLIKQEDKVSKYISDFPRGNEISIQHLIDNQSGLPRRFTIDQENLIEKNPAELVTLIKEEKLLFEPGTETLYSNLGYQVLYFIISEITKKPFVQYLEDNFFQPLNMNNTGAHFHLNKNNLKTYIQNHEEDDGQIITVPNIEKDGKNQAKIYSSTNDLLKFINHIKQEPYRSAMKNSKNAIGWSGGGDGLFCHANASLDSNYDLVFFSNYDAIPFGKILSTVDKIMNRENFELPKKVSWKAVSLKTSDLKKYVGKYNVREFNNDIFGFTIEKDSLVFYQNGERNSAIIPANDSTFYFESNEENHFQFRKTESDLLKLIFIYKGVEFEGLQIK